MTEQGWVQLDFRRKSTSCAALHEYHWKSVPLALRRDVRASARVRATLLGHVLGQLHEVLALLPGQQRQDLAVAVHAVLLLAQPHVQVGALPQVAHVGGVAPYGCGGVHVPM